MKRKAFTLVELLVVVSLIALLITILAPSLSRAKELAMMTRCQHNLHEVSQAFHAAANASVGAVGLDERLDLLHNPATWPNVPMNAVSELSIYKCPGQPETSYSVDQYYIHSNFDGTNTDGTGLDIYFDKGHELCRIVEETDEYIDYGFEDGVWYDLYHGSIDVLVRVSKTSPPTGTYLYDTYRGHTTGTLSLCVHGKVIWDDFRNVAMGQTFSFEGGFTNYGMNGRVGRHDIPAGTIVLLDYDRVVANRNEDITSYLLDAAKRHAGKINVLFRDGSVRAFGPAGLEPDIGSNDRMWNP